MHSTCDIVYIIAMVDVVDHDWTCFCSILFLQSILSYAPELCSVPLVSVLVMIT